VLRSPHTAGAATLILHLKLIPLLECDEIWTDNPYIAKGLPRGKQSTENFAAEIAEDAEGVTSQM
jgi:hypothetical protein